MISYNNQADGHTYYWYDSDLWACPTNDDGTGDFENAVAVDDFDTPLSDTELHRIKNILYTKYQDYMESEGERQWYEKRGQGGDC